MTEEREVSRGERERQPLHEAWHTIFTPVAHYAVSGVMARHVERELARWPRPRWIVFVDLGGARIRVRSRLIESVEQTTEESRRLWRTIRGEWEREYGAPRNEWEQ